MIDPSLLAPDRLNDLGPGSPNVAVRELLQELETTFVAQAKHRDFALACMAGLWLLHDFHEKSHAISQDLPTVEGSYWHGILHRREPDAWNAKYWFRNVKAHPVLELLKSEAPRIGYTYTNPADFVDFCDRARDSGSSDEALAKQVQMLEWRLLFDYCYRRALEIPHTGTVI